MATYDDYVRGILEQIGQGYAALEGMDDRPGSLGDLCREVERINGLMRVVANKVDPTSVHAAGFGALRAKMARYSDGYSFSQEMETMSVLYSGDAGRIRSMRLKVLEALHGEGMAESIREVMGEL